MAIVAFLESKDYESAVRNAMSYGSDSDTIACMAGAIAEAFYGDVPQSIVDFCKQKMPDEIRNLLKEFYESMKV